MRKAWLRCVSFLFGRNADCFWRPFEDWFAGYNRDSARKNIFVVFFGVNRNNRRLFLFLTFAPFFFGKMLEMAGVSGNCSVLVMAVYALVIIFTFPPIVKKRALNIIKFWNGPHSGPLAKKHTTSRMAMALAAAYIVVSQLIFISLIVVIILAGDGAPRYVLYIFLSAIIFTTSLGTFTIVGIMEGRRV